MLSYIWLIPVLPLLSAVVTGCFGKRYLKEKSHVVACAAVGVSFAISLIALFWLLSLDPNERTREVVVYEWIGVGGLSADFGFLLDPLSAVMIVVVSGVAFLIHIYSIGYMHGDGGYYRFFAYLPLFTAAMLILVLANNFLLMFVGWEGVGLCSYLLIGFWFERDAAANAGKKAFIVNRIGDVGFLLGIMAIFVVFNTVEFREVFGAIADKKELLSDPTPLFGLSLATVIALLLFVGATGKSAQIPLYVWLPDAMEGPTPVSALIHAATMVTAGVYMVARCSFLFVLSPFTMNVIAVIGALTAFYAATIALAQYDIKRVLAYSTISQLGYMFLALGAAGFTAGVFHLMTHAFFKALLFLCAGSVMHAMGGELDIRKMGGLRHRMPWTFRTFLIATFAIAGVPLLSGFFSKDEVLWSAWTARYAAPALQVVLGGIGTLTAGLTAFYMFRLLFIAFCGERRAEEGTGRGIHESPHVMTVPLIIFAVLSVIAGYVGAPEFLGGSNMFHSFLAETLAHPGAGGTVSTAKAWTATISSVIVVSAGILVAYLIFLRKADLAGEIRERLAWAFKVLSNKYYVDEVYNAIFVRPCIGVANGLRWIDANLIDGIVDLSGRVTVLSGGLLRKLQNGDAQLYGMTMALGLLVIISLYLIF